MKLRQPAVGQRLDRARALPAARPRRRVARRRSRPRRAGGPSSRPGSRRRPRARSRASRQRRTSVAPAGSACCSSGPGSADRASLSTGEEARQLPPPGTSSEWVTLPIDPAPAVPDHDLGQPGTGQQVDLLRDAVPRVLAPHVRPRGELDAHRPIAEGPARREVGDGQQHVELGRELTVRLLEGQVVDPELGHQQRPRGPLARRVERVGRHPQGDAGQGEGRVGRFTHPPGGILAARAGVR